MSFFRSHSLCNIFYIVAGQWNTLIMCSVNNHHSSIIRFTIISTPLLSLCEGCKFGCRYIADNVDMQQTPIILMQMSPDCGWLCPALPAHDELIRYPPPSTQPPPRLHPCSRSFLSLLAHCSTSSCWIDVAHLTSRARRRVNVKVLRCKSCRQKYGLSCPLPLAWCVNATTCAHNINQENIWKCSKQSVLP